LRRRDHASRHARSSSLNWTAAAVGVGMTDSYRNRKRIKQTGD
jgi:hypothetical protein